MIFDDPPTKPDINLPMAQTIERDREIRDGVRLRKRTRPVEVVAVEEQQEMPCTTG